MSTVRKARATLLGCLFCAFGFWIIPGFGQQDPVLTGEIKRLELELETLRSRYTEAHPAVVATKRSIEELRKTLASEDAETGRTPDELGLLKVQLKILLSRFTEAHPEVKDLRARIAELEQGKTMQAPQSDALDLSASPKLPESAPKPQLSEKHVPARQTFYVDGVLRLPITVQEVAGVGATQYPITAVIPLPYGRYQELSSFRITDAQGAEVPAQYAVLDRWWNRDGSIRHLKVDFQPTVEPFLENRRGTGTSTYYLSDDGPGNAAKTDLRVTDQQDYIDVVTGPLRFRVSKEHFRFFDKVWLDRDANGVFEDAELIVKADKTSGATLFGRASGDRQRDNERRDLLVRIEESGPLRVVIRAEAPTNYGASQKHTHGFATRIYAYAGKSYVKIDYQLQNSDKEPVYAGPLYFEALTLDFPLRLQGEPVVRIGAGDGKILKRPRGNGILLAQESQNAFSVRDTADAETVASGNKAEGFLDISDSAHGVAAFIRFFWETWPNGLAVTAEDRLSLQLFPEFGAQRHGDGLHATSLYWLADMQHVYKEALLFFHKDNLANDELLRQGETLHRPPVATLPSNWYAETGVTLDLGGVIPSKALNQVKERHYQYRAEDFEPRQYRFGWNDFYLIDPSRKTHPATAGGWAYGKADYVLSESAADVSLLEILGIGELNTRPHWLSGYRYTADFDRIRLGERLPWQAASWRKGGNNGGGYIAGTAQEALPRDDSHGWYYHVRESYYATANPWIKDWFQFIAEYRKASLDRHWGLSSRAIGHALASAVDAFRVTGDSEILALAQRDINERLRKEQHPIYGFRNSLCCGKYGESAFQVGFLARAIINFMEEVDRNSQAYTDAFQFLSGLMFWNLHFANFSYYLDARKGDLGQSNGTALTLIDPQAWYYWQTGKQAYWDQIENYLDGGIQGQDPFGEFRHWHGQFEGRFYQWVTTQIRQDAVPPAPIEDLRALRIAQGTVLRFSAPPDAVRYHIVWGDKPIVEGANTDPTKLNWWAANALSSTAASPAGKEEMIRIPGDAKYAAVFSFDAANNMSALSNVAVVPAKDPETETALGNAEAEDSASH